MKNRILAVCCSLIAVSLIVSCRDNNKSNETEPGPGGIYFDYRVWGNEDDSIITVRLQYRGGGPTGSPVLLETPAKVELDGQLLMADSSKLSGYYYELQIPADSFTGKHTITFTAPDNQVYNESFSFHPFSLQDSLAGIIRRKDFFIKLTGLDSVDYLRVVVTDTAFASKDINMMDTVRNGELRISERQLRNLVNGPGWIDLYKEEGRGVKKGANYNGIFSLTYGIKRGYILAD
jgi:hypothetical protein